MFKHEKLFSARGVYFYKIYRYFLLFLTPVAIISVISYVYIRSSMTREFDQYNRNIVNSTAIRLENEFKELKSLGDQFIKGTDNNFRNHVSNLTGRDILNIMEGIQNLTNLSVVKGSIFNTFYIVPHKKILVTNSGTYKYDQFINYFNKFEKYDLQFWDDIASSIDILKVLDTTKVYVGSYSKKENETAAKSVIPLVLPMYEYGRSESLLVININEEYIRRLLRDYEGPDHEIFILSSDGNLISHVGNSDVPEDNYSVLAELMNSRESSAITAEKVSFGGETRVIFAKSTAFPQWYVFTMISESKYYQNLNFVQKTLLLINGLILLTGFIFANIFSGKLYSPIYSLVDTLNKYSEDKYKGKKGNEIEFIVENLSFLRKTRDELDKKVMEMQPYVQERIIQNLIRTDCSYADQQEILDLFRGNVIKLDKKYYLVTVFHVNYSSAFLKDFSEEEQARIKAGVFNIIKSLICMKFRDSIFIDEGNGRYYALSNFDSMDEMSSYDTIIRGIGAVLRNDSDYIKVLISVGRTVNRLLSIKESYQEAWEALNYIDLDRDNFIYFSEQTSKEVSIYFPFNTEERLTNMIAGNQKEQIAKLISDIFDENFSRNKLVGKLRKLCQMLFNMYEMITLRFDIDLDDTDNNIGMREFATIDEAREEFTRIFCALCNMVGTNETEKKITLQEYIRQNFTKEGLSLDRMADDMKLNAAYLSRLFKEQTGETFSSFVARTRMEKARDLLVTTDISVEEIGRMVGVSSRSTFNRLFKKFVGVSPGTYRIIRK